jgi:hypothetical protein
VERRCPRSSEGNGQNLIVVCGICGGTHVVPLRLEPVEWVLSTVSAVTGCSFLHTVGRVGATSAGDLWFCQRNVRGGASDIALESGHIIYTQGCEYAFPKR